MEEYFRERGWDTATAMTEQQGKAGHRADFTLDFAGLSIQKFAQSGKYKTLHYAWNPRPPACWSGLIEIEIADRFAAVSGDSFWLFLTASRNFFSRRSPACFWASTDWRKIDSRRLSCSFIALAAASKSLNVLGLTAAVWAMMPLAVGSIFSTALQQGQVISKADELSAMQK